MKKINRELTFRVSLTLMILLSGVAMVPFVDLPNTEISWEVFANVYAPELTVNEPIGGPGSIFAFTGNDYPPSSIATVYVDGRALGSVMTDAGGMATFLLDTTGAPLGQYNVTLEVDINASATQSIELVADQPPVLPPPGFVGDTFRLAYPLYLPVVLTP